MIRAGRGGAIVSISSIAGSSALGRGNFVYSVTKAGIIQFTRELAVEWAPYKIRVNAISAGPLRTLAAAGISDFKSMLHHVAERAPLKRNIDAEEVGKTALYLCSDWGSAVTGEVVHVDAGYNIMGM